MSDVILIAMVLLVVAGLVWTARRITKRYERERQARLAGAHKVGDEYVSEDGSLLSAPKTEPFDGEDQ